MQVPCITATSTHSLRDEFLIADAKGEEKMAVAAGAGGYGGVTKAISSRGPALLVRFRRLWLLVVARCC